MNSFLRTSQRGFELIKKYEGFRDYIYKCPKGIPTIGYGHAINLKQIELVKALTPLSREKAESFLKEDVKAAEAIVNSSVKVDLTQGNYDALVSLIYNWGGYNFKLSDGLKKLNAKDYKGAAYEFFDEKNGVIKVNGEIFPGLVKRRRAEFELWNEFNG